MLKGAGYQIFDLGTDISPEKFVSEIREKKPDIVAMSALLTTTMSYMKTTIDAIKKAGLRNKVKIIVGGAPITQAYAKQIGADGYAKDAAEAVNVVRSIS
jgi:5-methyltetrahydrofolate--homocysteine methyltransferase